MSNSTAFVMQGSSHNSPPRAIPSQEPPQLHNHLRTKAPPPRGLSLLEDWLPARKSSQSSEGQTGATQYQRNLDADLLQRTPESAFSRSLFDQSATAIEPYPSTSAFPLTQDSSSTSAEPAGFPSVTAVRTSDISSSSSAPGSLPFSTPEVGFSAISRF